MLIHRFAVAAFAASVMASSALATESTVPPPTLPPPFQHHGPNSKDHTPVLEQCDAYQAEFNKAIAHLPATRKVVEAQRLDRDGVRLCRMEETKATQGANEIAEALHLIGVQPTL